jgi:glyoxylase-like metal-dependent hydrolase (beta-lactamase superfamily II)
VKNIIFPLVVTILLFGFSGCAKSNETSNKTYESKYFEIKKLSEGVYAVIGDKDTAASNSAIVDLGGKTLVLDAMNDIEAAKDLRKAAKYLTGRDADYLVISHWHADHTAGTDVFSKKIELVSLKDTDGKRVIEGKKRSVELKAYSGIHSGSDTVMFLPEDGIVFLADIKYAFGYNDPDKLDDVMKEYGAYDIKGVVWGHGPLGTRDDVRLMNEVISWVRDSVKKLIDDGEDYNKIQELKLPEKYQKWDQEIADMSQKCISFYYNKFSK